MTVVYITSDWHLGHRNVAKWRESYTYPPLHPDLHDEFILEQYRKTVTKRDIVWFLGDIIMDPKYLEVVKELPGRKHIVLGNHDTKPDSLARGITARDLVEVFENVVGLVKYKDVWLSHAPVHTTELRGKVNLHGHTHINVIQDQKDGEVIDDPRYINCCVEHTHFAPMSFQKLRPRINKGKEYATTLVD